MADPIEMYPTVDPAFRRDVYEAIGWFFAGAYLDHPDKINSVVAIVDLYRADQRETTEGTPDA